MISLWNAAEFYGQSYYDEVRKWRPDPRRFPFYDLVPKDEDANREYRLDLLESTATNRQEQAEQRDMCRRDILYWLNSFCWLYEPRPRPRTIPFITWPHQDPMVAIMDECLGHRDVGVEKSRGEGASWLSLMVFLKYWLFGDAERTDIKQFSFGLVSRTEEAVDDANDPDSLMWKCDFQLKHLPPWMVPHIYRNRSRHILRNDHTGSTIVGYSATGEVASGGRKTSFLLDEMSKFPKGADYDAMSSTQYVTDCRFVVSTFKGNYGYYYDAMRGPASSIRRVIMDWKDNPLRNPGLYEFTKGDLLPLRPDRPVESKYRVECKDILARLRTRGFQIENKVRSAWYDGQCDRTGATPASIAEELDRDPERSGSPFFTPDVINRLLKDCTHPSHVGNIDFEMDSCLPTEWIDDGEGLWRLWLQFLQTGNPANDIDYFMGIDVAAGGGGSLSSNSVICIANRRGEKVGEFASPNVLPMDLARVAYAAGHWFVGPMGPARLIFEANGSTGSQFSKQICELAYPNLYMDIVETAITHKRTKKPGYQNQQEKRGILYGGYRQALSDGMYLNPSRDSLEECKFYEHLPGGHIEHIAAADKKRDPSGAGHNHGDRCTADALCWRALSDFYRKSTPKQPEIDTEITIESPNAPMGSFLHRRNEKIKRKPEFSWS